ncbi:ATP-binding protein [Streptacidiphilus sp. EB103A]|uniref:ATP-binding protein n=1 Tax=Streptacidiphilus sp. EB103A TaxID=3156275 RepID=UPI003519401C
MAPAQAVLERPGALDRPPEHQRVDLTTCEHPTNVARRALRSTLRPRTSDARIDDVVLVATELIANAGKHADGAVRMLLDLYEDCLVLWVFDRAADRCDVTPRQSADTDQDGRGLGIVTALTDHWFLWRAEDGKAVVAVFLLPPEERAPR